MSTTATKTIDPAALAAIESARPGTTNDFRLDFDFYDGDPKNHYAEMRDEFVTFVAHLDGAMSSNELLDAIDAHAKRLAREHIRQLIDESEYPDARIEKLDVEAGESFTFSAVDGRRLRIIFTLIITASVTTYGKAAA